MRNPEYLVLLLAWLLLFPPAAPAQESDRRQPVQIEADRLEIDQARGTSHYQGAVILRQGSLRLEADSLWVYSQDRRLSRVIAQGQPARLRQRPDGTEQAIEAEALRIEYTTDDGLLIFSGAAELRQGGNRFRGQRIEYDSRARRVRASGDTTDEGHGRIQVIIQPQTRNRP